jgi:hypothetical protein
MVSKFAFKFNLCRYTVEDLLKAKPERNVCLVDFQQQSQLNKAIPMVGGSLPRWTRV